MLMKSSKSEQSHHSIGLRIVYPFLRINIHGKCSCSVTEGFCDLPVNSNAHTYIKFYFFILGKKENKQLRFCLNSLESVCFVLFLSRKEAFCLGHADLILCLFLLHTGFIKMLSSISDFFSAAKQLPIWTTSSMVRPGP